MNWKVRFSLSVVVASLTVLLSALVVQNPAYGQGGTGELTGTVYDPAGATRMVKAQQTVYHDAGHPSALILPVVPRP